MVRLCDMGSDYLEIPVRAYHVFKREGITTIGQIDDMTDAELLRCRGLGRQTLDQVRQAVDRFRDRWHLHGRVRPWKP